LLIVSFFHILNWLTLLEYLCKFEVSNALMRKANPATLVY